MRTTNHIARTIKAIDVKALRYAVATLELFSMVNKGAAGPLRV